MLVHEHTCITAPKHVSTQPCLHALFSLLHHSHTGCKHEPRDSTCSTGTLLWGLNLHKGLVATTFAVRVPARPNTTVTFALLARTKLPLAAIMGRARFGAEGAVGEAVDGRGLVVCILKDSLRERNTPPLTGPLAIGNLAAIHRNFFLQFWEKTWFWKCALLCWTKKFDWWLKIFEEYGFEFFCSKCAYFQDRNNLPAVFFQKNGNTKKSKKSRNKKNT